MKPEQEQENNKPSRKGPGKFIAKIAATCILAAILGFLSYFVAGSFEYTSETANLIGGSAGLIGAYIGWRWSDIVIALMAEILSNAL